MNGIQPIKAELDRRFAASLAAEQQTHCLELATFAQVRMGQRPWTAPERQHLEHCPRCRHLWQQWQQSAGPAAAETPATGSPSARDVATQQEAAADRETQAVPISEATGAWVRRLRDGDPATRRTLRDAYLPALRGCLTQLGFSPSMSHQLAERVLGTAYLRMAKSELSEANFTFRELLLEELLHAAPQAASAESRTRWAEACARSEYQLAVEHVRATCDNLAWRAFALTVLSELSFDEAAQQLDKTRAWVVTQAAIISVRILDQAQQYSSAIVTSGVRP